MADEPKTAGGAPDLPAHINGTPVEPTDMVRHVAAPMMSGVRNVHSGHPAQGLTPRRLAGLLLAAEQGDATSYLELAEEMEEKDLHYLSVLQTRKRAVAQLPLEVLAAGDSEEEEADAQLVRDWLERDTLETELFDILDAVGKGYSAVEIIWRRTSTSWLPTELVWRDPRWFEFDRVDQATLLLKTNTGPQPLQPFKYILHQHQAKSGIIIRGGIARAAAWGYLFKNYGVKDWIAFLDAFGTPLRVGRYDNGADEKDVRFLMQAVAQLGADAAAVFPKSMDVEFIDRKQGTAPNDLWRSLVEYVDGQISKAVLGQTNTTDAQAGGLGSGQAQVHNEVRGDIERHDAKLLAATLNRDLVVPMVMFNRGPRERYPRIRIGRPEEHDVKALTEALQVLVPMGLQVGVKTIRERVGLPEPEAGEEVLTAPATNGAPGGGEGAGRPQGAGKPSTPLLDPLKRPEEPIAEGAAGPDIAVASVAGRDSDADRQGPDAIDLLADAGAAEWEPLLSGAVTQIEEVLSSASNVAELEAGLAALGARLDTSEFQQAIARAAFTARLAGEVAVAGEQREGS